LSKQQKAQQKRLKGQLSLLFDKLSPRGLRKMKKKHSRTATGFNRGGQFKGTF